MCQSGQREILVDFVFYFLATIVIPLTVFCLLPSTPVPSCGINNYEADFWNVSSKHCKILNIQVPFDHELKFVNHQKIRPEEVL